MVPWVCISSIILLFVDKTAGPWGCLIDVVVFIIIVVASVFMSSSNDAKLIESLENSINKRSSMTMGHF